MIRELELSGYRVVTPNAVLRHGLVRVRDDRIVEVRDAVRSASDHSGHWLVPGFVDMHVHGGGGYSFTAGDPAEARGAAEFHFAHGTTTLLASLVTAPLDRLAGTVRAYGALVDSGMLAGVHCEGPFLSRTRCGAHNPEHLRSPEAAELVRLMQVAGGTVRMVTIAPELPGAIDAIHQLRERGVLAAIGHTDATYAQTLAAVHAGATVATHLFNAMPAPRAREPGPVLALLTAPTVTCELIADGLHLHDALLRFATGSAGSARTALITDAMSAAGMSDGRYDLGGQAVLVHDSVARLEQPGAQTGSAPAGGVLAGGVLAGSTLTMDAALRHVVHLGASMVDAARMAATTPARTLGLRDRGAIVPGLRADLVVLDEALRVRRVLRAGRWHS
jgi:N-acetylglucosamine-6-phosphate deacetylase